MKRSVKHTLIAIWAVGGVAVGGVGAAVLYLHGRPQPVGLTYVEPKDDAQLPTLFDVPPFTLTDQDGRPIGNKDLSGKIWVADFIFTHCGSICPMMTEQMRRAQQQTTGVEFVSFTVDPDRDTPAVLRQYGADHKADPARWHFVTGPAERLSSFAHDMKVPYEPGEGPMTVMHDSHFLLVDGTGRVRGTYNSKSAGFDAELLDGIKKLQAERKGS